jgi:hypothetical protein
MDEPDVVDVLAGPYQYSEWLPASFSSLLG